MWIRNFLLISFSNFEGVLRTIYDSRESQYVIHTVYFNTNSQQSITISTRRLYLNVYLSSAILDNVFFNQCVYIDLFSLVKKLATISCVISRVILIIALSHRFARLFLIYNNVSLGGIRPKSRFFSCGSQNYTLMRNFSIKNSQTNAHESKSPVSLSLSL